VDWRGGLHVFRFGVNFTSGAPFLVSGHKRGAALRCVHDEQWPVRRPCSSVKGGVHTALWLTRSQAQRVWCLGGLRLLNGSILLLTTRIGTRYRRTVVGTSHVRPRALALNGLTACRWGPLHMSPASQRSRVVNVAARSIGAGLLLVGLAWTSAAQANSVDRGRSFVMQNCSPCHSVQKTGESPNPQAPPLRDLHKRYAVEGLAEAFAEGIYVGHSSMPQFRLEPKTIGDLIDYLKSLEG
jgi:mono/diheme cytochrome c family protein